VSAFIHRCEPRLGGSFNFHSGPLRGTLGSPQLGLPFGCCGCVLFVVFFLVFFLVFFFWGFVCLWFRVVFLFFVVVFLLWVVGFGWCFFFFFFFLVFGIRLYLFRAGGGVDPDPFAQLLTQ